MIATVLRDGEHDFAVEEPLEIRVDGEPLLVTMRTPRHDEELALGFLYGEGLINGARKAGLSDDFAANTIDVAGPLARDPGGLRFYTTCPAPRVRQRSDRALLAALPDRLCQPMFDRTGGLDATGLFTAGGELVIVRKDVGRHNSMDTVIGRALLDGLCR